MFVVSAVIVIGGAAAYAVARLARHVLYVVPEGELHVVQRWGRFRPVRRPGLRLRFPGMERISRVPDRPFAAPFSASGVTVDGVAMAVDGCLELHIEEPLRYVWGFSMVRSAGAELTATVVGEVIRRHGREQVESRDLLAREVGLVLDLELDRFGLGVTRVVVTGIRRLDELPEPTPAAA